MQPASRLATTCVADGDTPPAPRDPARRAMNVALFWEIVLTLVHFIGVGEGIDDLAPFTARDFARAIAGQDN